jgi:hypothetical protein
MSEASLDSRALLGASIWVDNKDFVLWGAQ